AFHGAGDARLDFQSHHGALGIERRPVLALAFKKIGDAFFVVAGIELRRLIFGTGLPSAQVVQADIGDDAVEPGIEAAFEAKAVEIAVNLEEGFLINIAGIFGCSFYTWLYRIVTNVCL